MGVTSLWSILQSCGSPISPDSLQGKILAIDISIWLHQALHGSVNPNLSNNKPHLHLVLNRLFKLLHYKIKPVFVFDGGIPVLKRRTLLARQEKRNNASGNIDDLNANIIKGKLWNDILKKYVGIDKPLKSFNNLDKDLFELPSIQTKNALSETDLEWEKRKLNIIEAISVMSKSANIDIESELFKGLPKEIQHEILQELQFSNKHPSMQHLVNYTDKSEEFSQFQIERLVKRSKVTGRIDNLNRSMNIDYINKLHQTNADEKVDPLLIDLSNAEIQRLASDETVHYVLIKRKSHQTNNSLFKQDYNMVEENKYIKQEFESEDLSVEEKSNIQHINISQNNNFKDEFHHESLYDETSQSNDITENYPEFVQRTEIAYDNNNHNNFSKKQEKFSSNTIDLPKSDTNPLNTEEKHGNTHKNLKNVAKKCDLANKQRKLITKPPRIYANNAKRVRRKFFVNKSNLSSTKYSYFSLKSIRRKMLMQRVKSLPYYHKKIKLTKSARDDRIKTLKTSKVKLPARITKASTSKNQYGSHKSVDFWPKLSSDLPNTTNIAYNNNNIFDGKSADNDNFDKNVINNNEKDCQTPDIQNDIFYNNPVLASLKDKLEYDQKETYDNVLALNIEKAKLERYSKTMTEVIYQETQQLLQILGMPYLIAPQEAEAQCAYLDRVNLTQGTLTEDSDTFLFGASRVYRNFFTNSPSKHLEAYRMAEIERKLGINRDTLIFIAMMVGSDYTEGIKGIGPVLALQIISEFQIRTFEQFLQFKTWLDTNKHSLNTLMSANNQKVKGKLANILQNKFSTPSSDPYSYNFTPLKKKLLESNTIYFPPTFPDAAIYDAYLDPVVDPSTERFVWGDLQGLFGDLSNESSKKPKSTPQINLKHNHNIDGGNMANKSNSTTYQRLLNFVREKMNWDAAKLDSYVNPLKKHLMHDQKLQGTIESYLFHNDHFSTGNYKMPDPEPPSKRILKAIEAFKRPRVNKITANCPKTSNLLEKNTENSRNNVKKLNTQKVKNSQSTDNLEKVGKNAKGKEIKERKKTVTSKKRNTKKLRFSKPSLQNEFDLNLSEQSD